MRTLTAVLLLFSMAATAQNPEQEPITALSYDYSSVYNSASASLTRHKAGFDYNIKQVTLSAGVSAYGIEYNNSGHTGAMAQNITSTYLSAGYDYTINSNWLATATFSPKLVSDFKGTGIKDVYPGFFAGFTYKPSAGSSTSLTFGAGYNGYFGKYRLMPIVNFKGNLTERASFNLGIPASWIAYKISATHSLKAFVASDGFYSRFTADTGALYPEAAKAIKSMEMVTINSGLEYAYHSGDEWTALVRAGYSIYNKLDVPLETGVPGIGFNNNLYLSAGFKYNLNFK